MTKATTASYITWTMTLGVASSKRFPVVMRICRHVEAACRRPTQRAGQGKQGGSHAMEKVMFIPEWSGGVHGVKIAITEE